MLMYFTMISLVKKQYYTSAPVKSISFKFLYKKGGVYACLLVCLYVCIAITYEQLIGQKNGLHN